MLGEKPFRVHAPAEISKSANNTSEIGGMRKIVVPKHGAEYGQRHQRPQHEECFDADRQEKEHQLPGGEEQGISGDNARDICRSSKYGLVRADDRDEKHCSLKQPTEGAA